MFVQHVSGPSSRAQFYVLSPTYARDVCMYGDFILKTREAEYQAVLPVAVYNCHNAYVRVTNEQKT